MAGLQHAGWLTLHWPGANDWAAIGAVAAAVSSLFAAYIAGQTRRDSLENARILVVSEVVDAAEDQILIERAVREAISPPIPKTAVGGSSPPSGKKLQRLQALKERNDQVLDILKECSSSLHSGKNVRATVRRSQMAVVLSRGVVLAYEREMTALGYKKA